MIYDDDDVQSLSLCAWKEARGEGTPGMLATMQVICNRAVAWFGNHIESIHNAVYAKNQFTSMSVPSDPEFNLAPGENDASFDFCVQMAPGVLQGLQPDTTAGALYYANLSEVTSGWFIENIVNDPGNHPKTAVIGRQTFFK
jgi:spore germination cell wall hydrolase CwlJ-like protein